MNRRVFMKTTMIGAVGVQLLPSGCISYNPSDSTTENTSEMEPNELAKILIDFTNAYKKYPDDKFMREAACLKIQQKGLFRPIRKGDLFAGRTAQLPVGFAPQSDEGALGYFIHPLAFGKLMDDPNLDEENRSKLLELEDFWKKHSTLSLSKKAFSPEMTAGLPSDAYWAEPGIAFTLWRMSGVQLDYQKLVRKGIPGLRAEINSYAAHTNPESLRLYEAMLIALDNLQEICLQYADEALSMSEKVSDEKERQDMKEMARILRKLPESKPETFREGIQLIFLYNAADGARNYGRLDDALAELYWNDLNENKLDEEEAIRLLSGMWQLIIDRNYRYDSRIIIGGKGRNNEEQANALALAIMETTRRVRDIVPQLALRFHKNQDPELYRTALDIIGEGNPFPMLYNDDVNIPASMEAFDIPESEANHIIQFGCGEYVIDHRSVGTPSGVINLLQALNVTLNRGIDPISGNPMGMPSEHYKKYGEFETFESLWKAYAEQVEFHVDLLAQHEELEYVMAAKHAPFLYSSILMDDCLQRGKAIYEGGIHYLGGTLESYGNSNTADALSAIRELVYEKKQYKIEEIKTCLENDFKDCELLRKKMLNCPKYGNDNDIADQMLMRVHNHVCNYTREQKNKTSLHSYLIVVINNDANTVMGEHTSASADGRKAFAYMNPGNAPVDGMDKSGLTAFLNSLVKPDTHIHAGAVQNMKFSKEMFSEYRDKLEILLETYWQKGGTQAMMTVIGRGDLEEAMKHPEKYQNLLVRVGGFSERFVNLPRHTQLEILNRTLY